MKLRFKLLTEVDKKGICELSLKSRAENNPLRPSRRQYIIWLENKEIAYLSFDLFPEQHFLVIYEIFVANDYRNQGFGTQILADAEQLIQKWGYNKIKLVPKSLEPKTSGKKLAKWYKEKGFIEDPTNSQVLEKSFVTTR